MTKSRDIADSTKTLDVDGGTIKLDGNYPVGTGNVALGDTALASGSLSGGDNTAIGFQALTTNTSGTVNTAVGGDALRYNTTGANNVSMGVNALKQNTSGSYNTGLGRSALQSNTTASNNTAVGYQALYSSNSRENVAVGYQAGKSLTSGEQCAFVGHYSGNATTGSRNNFFGEQAGYQVTTGANNTILGRYGGNQGGLDIRTSSNNIVLSDGDGNPRLRISSIGSMGFNYPALPSTLSTDTGSPLYVFRPSGNANATANYLNFGGTNRNANGLSKMLTFNHGYWGAGREVSYVGVVTASSSGGSGSGSGSIVFGTGSSGNGDSGSTVTESVRINSNGNFYVGTTTSGWEAALGTGYIAQDSYWKNTTNTSSQRAHWYFGNSNGWVGQIYTSGSSTTYSTSSDHRLKENVEYTWDATTRLKQLKPARFNFIADADTTVDGFLAHEAQAVVPESVSGTHNEVEVWKEGDELPDGVSVGDNKLDDDGNTIPVMQGIDQAKLVPLLVKTIQELEARITALEA